MPSFAALIASPNQTQGLSAAGVPAAETEKSAALFGMVLSAVEADEDAGETEQDAKDRAPTDPAPLAALPLIPAMTLVRPEAGIETPPAALCETQTPPLQTTLQITLQGTASQAEASMPALETAQIIQAEQATHSLSPAGAEVAPDDAAQYAQAVAQRDLTDLLRTAPEAPRAEPSTKALNVAANQSAPQLDEAKPPMNRGQAAIAAVLQSLDADPNTQITGTSLSARSVPTVDASAKAIERAAYAPAMAEAKAEPAAKTTQAQPVPMTADMAQAKGLTLPSSAPLAPAQQAATKHVSNAASSSQEPEAAGPEARPSLGVADKATTASPYSLITSVQAQLHAQSGQGSAAQDATPASFNPIRLDALQGETPQTDAGLSLEQTAPTLPTSGLAKATVETTAQISAQILRRLEGRTSRFDMTLTPEALGRVDVSLTIESDGQVTARLAFDNPAAAAELRGRVDELRRQLAEAGLDLPKENLEFTDRNPQSGSGQGAFDRQQDRRAFAGAGRLNDEADLATAVQPAPWATPSQTPDRVDVKV